MKLFEPEQLKVFDELPADQINTRIHETFVPKAPTPVVPASKEEWTSLATRLKQGLDDKVFRGWPDHEPSVAELEVKRSQDSTHDGLRFEQYEFTSQAPYRLPLFVVSKGEGKGPVTVIPLDQAGWELLQKGPKFPCRNRSNRASRRLLQAGRSTWNHRGRLSCSHRRAGSGRPSGRREKLPRTHVRRRFALLGQTDDGMRTWDVRCALKAARSIESLQGRPIKLAGSGDAAVWTLYASLYEPPTESVTLSKLPATHMEGPALLNVLRVLDVPTPCTGRGPCARRR